MAFMTLRHLAQVVDTAGQTDAAISSKLSVDVQAVHVQDDVKRSITIPPFSTFSVFDLRNSPTYDNTTEVEVFNPVATTTSRWRMEWTGTGTPVQFRTQRAIGVNATTVLSLMRQGDSPFMTLATVSGTALVTTAVQVGDLVFFSPEVDGFTPPVNTAVAGKYLRVVSKTVSTLDVRDDDGLPDQPTIPLGASFADALEVFSAAGTQVGDSMMLSVPFLPGNRGEQTVTAVSSRWVEFSSIEAVAQTITLTTGAVEVYDEVYDFVSVVADSPVTIVTLSGETHLGIVGGIAVFSATVSTPVLSLRNDGAQPALAQVLFLRSSGSC